MEIFWEIEQKYLKFICLSIRIASWPGTMQVKRQIWRVFYRREKKAEKVTCELKKQKIYLVAVCASVCDDQRIKWLTLIIREWKVEKVKNGESLHSAEKYGRLRELPGKD